MDIKVNALNNDILIENNRFSFAEETDYVEQKLKFNLLTFLGECFLDTDVGTPYFQQILTKNVNLAQIEGALKDVILQTPGVINLLSFELSYDNALRRLLVSFSAETQTGVIDISQLEIF